MEMWTQNQSAQLQRVSFVYVRFGFVIQAFIDLMMFLAWYICDFCFLSLASTKVVDICSLE